MFQLIPNDVFFAVFAVTVGNNENAISLVRGVKPGRSVTIPFRIIPNLGKVTEHLRESSCSQSRHIFTENPFGGNFFDDPHSLFPES
jgi:hypothetical protein